MTKFNCLKCDSPMRIVVVSDLLSPPQYTEYLECLNCGARNEVVYDQEDNEEIGKPLGE